MSAENVKKKFLSNAQERYETAMRKKWMKRIDVAPAKVVVVTYESTLRERQRMRVLIKRGFHEQADYYDALEKLELLDHEIAGWHQSIDALYGVTFTPPCLRTGAGAAEVANGS